MCGACKHRIRQNNNDATGICEGKLYWHLIGLCSSELWWIQENRILRIQLSISSSSFSGSNVQVRHKKSTGNFKTNWLILKFNFVLFYPLDNIFWERYSPFKYYCDYRCPSIKGISLAHFCVLKYLFSKYKYLSVEPFFFFSFFWVIQ